MIFYTVESITCLKDLRFLRFCDIPNICTYQYWEVKDKRRHPQDGVYLRSPIVCSTLKFGKEIKKIEDRTFKKSKYKREVLQ